MAQGVGYPGPPDGQAATANIRRRARTAWAKDAPTGAVSAIWSILRDSLLSQRAHQDGSVVVGAVVDD